ncbi:FecCD family ABC transporter permease [Roseibium sp.]|uniref:FecCD family ABC transporter permease n=1 Tax=Roseibium sp. TaxID=1936156 RepID=UPI003A96C161
MTIASILPRPGLARPRSRARLEAVQVIILCVVLGALAALALTVGTRAVSLQEVASSFLEYDPASPSHIVVQTFRVPRLIAALLVGAALAASGTLMQDMTRNPLADPGLMGVNAGAAFGVVLAIWLFRISDPGMLIWPAIAGAGLSGLFVHALGSAGGGASTPIRYLLAGAATSALLFGLIRMLLLLSQETLDVYRFWIVGSLTGTRLDDLVPLLPFFGIGFAGAIAGARMLNALSLGEDAARSLGTDPAVIRIWNMAAVTCLCGAAVALAGPIGFIGLVVPHIARSLFGVTSLRVLISGTLIGAILLLSADIAGRLVFAHSDLQAGVTVTLIGAPVFIWLIRRTRLMRQ